MRIETKFAIGDSVWGILDGRAHGFEIVSMEVSRNAEGRYIADYRDRNYRHYAEDQCFETKEELAAYFMGEA